MPRIVDLSAPIASSAPGTPDFQRNAIEYIDHAAGAREIEQLYGVPAAFLRRGEGWTRELVSLGTHNSAALEGVAHALSPGDIVLMHTGRDAYYGRRDYIDRGPGVTAAATRWMHERGVRVMGIDAWGWDRPLRLQAAEALLHDTPGVLWEAHQADLDYCQIERLVNLDQMPSTGATVACFPLRLVRASAAPARVVGILPH